MVVAVILALVIQMCDSQGQLRLAEFVSSRCSERKHLNKQRRGRLKKTADTNFGLLRASMCLCTRKCTYIYTFPTKTYRSLYL